MLEKKLAPEQLAKERYVDKFLCETEHLFFTQLFFKHRQSTPFRINWHHYLFSDIIEKIMNGELKNVVINVSPGSSKTETVVVNFIARGLALNPWCKFLHLSYSDDLALLNSKSARDLIDSDEYQDLWPLQISDDAKSKKRWNVLVNGKEAGGVYATALGGQVTGFRAGRMVPGFQGAILIDDPLKPEDAYSKSKLDLANRKLLTTVQSRKANPDTPIVVIMQRIGENDPSDFIKQGALGTDWTHIIIPAVIDDAYVASLDSKYKALVDASQKVEERFSYWPYKEPIEQLLAMERGEGANISGSRISRYVFASQYQQSPKAIGGNIIKGDWFPRYRMLPKIKYRKIFADTAQKTKEYNDFSVFECWGYGEDHKLYLLDMIRGRWEAPELKRKCVEFWNKHKPNDGDALKALKASLYWAHWMTDDEKLGQLRELKVEDKSSGTGLIQEIKLVNHIPVKPIERVIDKLTRVMDVVSYWESGLVCLPADAPFTLDFIAECEAFTADDSHAFDDQIDPMTDATVDILSSGNKLKLWEKII